MKMTNPWQRMPRRARIGTAVGVPVLGLAVAAALVVTMTGGWPLDRGTQNTASAGQDRDVPGSGTAEPHPDSAPPVPPPSISPSPSLSPSPSASPSPERHVEHPNPAPAVVVPENTPRPDPNGAAVYLEARLDGRSEVPVAGGPAVGDKNGHARAWLRVSGNQVCFSLAWRKLATVTNAHIHAGARGANGAPQVTFFGALPASLQTAVGCVLVDDTAKLGGVLANPDGHYVNLHSADAPGGAVRGQLRRLDHAVDLLEPVRGPLVALARGEVEVPAAGDFDGAATGFVRPRGNEIRYGITWNGTGAPTNAHLHAGRLGVAGPVSVGFFDAPAGLPASLFAVAGGVQADPRLAARINQDPAGYYLNLHTAQFAKGAVRGQLFRAG